MLPGLCGGKMSSPEKLTALEKKLEILFAQGNQKQAKEKVLEFVDSKLKEETSIAVCKVSHVGYKPLTNVE